MPICNWWMRETPLVTGKRSCEMCLSHSYRKCIRSKRPFEDAKVFTLHTKRCNACQCKYLKEMASRQSSSKIIVGDSDDQFASTASSQGESSAEFKIKPVKKSTVKRQVQKTPTRQAPRKRKVQQQEQHGEALKKILLEFVQDEGCLKKLLDGKRISFVPVLL